MATISFRTTLRTARIQAIITDAGATGAKAKLYNGTQPANAAASLSGNTLLATLNWTSVPIGTATSGTLDWDEASMTQTTGSHVAGTPTFMDITTSADVVVARIPMGTNGFTFTGAVATSQNVTLTSLVLTEGNA
jgi:hypothetical protein